ncbi:MAG: hypothetical protein ABI981_04585 [Betaproteobacteria bacterium]
MPWRAAALALFAVLAASALPAAAQPTAVVQPLALPGPYPVACSNVTQDFSRLAQGEDVQAYWEGVPRTDGSPRYVTSLLSDAANTLSLTVAVPNDGAIYGSFAGISVPVVVLVCYPTTAGNARADYVLPTGKRVPRMQRGNEAPILADAAARYPVLLFSHGYLGSPISNDYIDAVSILASYGYVVAAPLHGDGRISLLQLSSLNDLPYAISHLRDFLAMQALRPLALSATLDLLFANGQWKDHLDAARVGGFGASLGGESLLLMAGAGLTSSIGLSWTRVETDSRLKAAVGYVPYFGQPFVPAFGRDQRGLDDVTLPYLAIAGTADTTAPIASTTQGVQRLQGPRELVALTGVTHQFDVPSTNDIFTWSVTFLDTHVKQDVSAASRLAQMGSVAGGGEDRVVIAVALPVTINYSGLWWRSPAGSESGWGLNVAHQGDVIFATWFTYNDAGNSLWVSMTANKVSDGLYSGTLYRSAGPAFYSDPFDPSLVTRVAVGNASLTFTDGNNGFFSYTLNGVTQTKPITHQVFGPLPTCTWPAPTNLAAATNYQDLWWKPSESGWGINFAHEGNTIFATWFTYDVDGSPLWLSMTAQPTSGPTIWAGTLYRTTGPPFSAVPFDSDAVVRTLAGYASLSFTDGNSAIFTYSIYGQAQTKTITRQIFRPPGTVCQ